MMKIPPPRILPATIAAMAALLLLKSGILLHALITPGALPNGGMVAAANAASTDQTKEKPSAEAKPSSTTQQKLAAPAPPVEQGPPPVSDSEKALLQELRKRRQELDTRAAAVATGESVLVATEQKLNARVVELQALQKNLEGLDATRKQKEEAGWQGLVKLYESMKPKDAATIFNDLSMPVLLQILDRMKDTKAALVMAAMNPDKARDVTGELAQMRTKGDPSVTPMAEPKLGLAGG